MGLDLNMLENIELLVMAYEYDPHPSGYGHIHNKLIAPIVFFVSFHFN